MSKSASKSTNPDLWAATDVPVSSPPPPYMDLIAPLIARTREFLEAGKRLEAVAYVGNLGTKNILPVPIQGRSEDDKDESALTIQTAASIVEADFVFSVMESFCLKPDKLAQLDEILEKYGSIGTSPFAIDVCALTLETRHGTWFGQPPVERQGTSGDGRTFGDVEFRYYAERQARFAQLLPVKDDDRPPGMLH